MQTNAHRTGHLPRLPTGVEDTEGWAFKRARTCETTLSLEEFFDAADENVDVRAIRGSMITGRGFARFNGRWYLPLSRTAVSSGLDPASHPGEFIALDDAECMALERVVSHWRSQAMEDSLTPEEMAAEMRGMGFVLMPTRETP